MSFLLYFAQFWLEITY